MGWVKITVYEYTCDRCGKFVEFKEPNCLPEGWRHIVKNAEASNAGHLLCDGCSLEFDAWFKSGSEWMEHAHD